MWSEPTAVSRLFEAEEHVEVCESHINSRAACLPGYLARGEDPAELSRLMGLMSDLLDGFRDRRALAAAEMLELQPPQGFSN